MIQRDHVTLSGVFIYGLFSTSAFDTEKTVQKLWNTAKIAENNGFDQPKELNSDTCFSNLSSAR